MCNTAASASTLFVATIAVAFLPLAVVLAQDPVSSNRTDGGSRIIGGFEAPAESTRHQISLRVKHIDDRLFGRGHLCGGSLISERLVLTAAHCLVDVYGRPQAPDYFVVVGGNTERLVQTDNTFVSQIQKLIVHAAYDDEQYTNDIGLLHLISAVPTGHPTLQPIPMVEKTPPPDTACQVTGWGTTVSGVQGSTDLLMAINISIIDVAICNSTDSYDGEILPGMVCAGQLEGGKDSCQGDSGGPLVCDGVLAGTVSFGFECGLPNFPGVYADVAFYREWIRVNSASAGPMIGSWSLGLLLLFVPVLVLHKPT